MHAFDRFVRTAKAFARQRSGNEAGHRRPADLKALGPCAVRQELKTAAGLAERDAQRPGRLRRIKAHDARRGGGRAEGPAGGAWMKAASVVVPGREGGCNAQPDLVAGDDAGYDLGTRRFHHSGSRKRGRDDRCSRMQDGGRVGVVEIKRVGKRRVDERRACNGISGRIGDNGRGAGGQSKRMHRGQQRHRAFRIAARPDRVAEQIQHQQRNALQDIARQAGTVHGRNESRQFFGDVHLAPFRLPGGPRYRGAPSRPTAIGDHRRGPTRSTETQDPGPHDGRGNRRRQLFWLSDRSDRGGKRAAGAPRCAGTRGGGSEGCRTRTDCHRLYRAGRRQQRDGSAVE